MVGNYLDKGITNGLRKFLAEEESMMDQQNCLEELKHCLKTRNLYEARTLLVHTLSAFSGDREFLMICFELAKQDSLIFQKHNQELLDLNLENWNEEQYGELINQLEKNFSMIRYHLGLQLSLYFYGLKQKEIEAALEEEKKVIEKKKKWRERLRFPKRKKKIRSDHERCTLAGIQMTAFLLVWLIVELVLESTS